MRTSKTTGSLQSPHGNGVETRANRPGIAMQQHPVIAMPLKEDGVQRFNRLGGTLMHSCADRVHWSMSLSHSTVCNTDGPWSCMLEEHESIAHTAATPKH